ncbi:hypothetical protein H0H81_011454 [Sphagnurus paluster]|uniref:Uncharacterized protein n=1 Tax=Sphagnurus paluster TaxID=117069 RepID=A0A9P7GHG4_9AGAR|nr:hypothetical protein H0H81_011454 [Sphagnurus paluster]
MRCGAHAHGKSEREEDEQMEWPLLRFGVYADEASEDFKQDGALPGPISEVVDIDSAADLAARSDDEETNEDENEDNEDNGSDDDGDGGDGSDDDNVGYGDY